MNNAGTGRPWGAVNAGASTPGIDGASPADYNGPNDVASQPDAVVTMTAINEPFVVSGAGITDACRFWLQNPSVDYGHALRVRSRGSWYHEAKFESAQAELSQRAPILTITYSLPQTVSTMPPEVSGPLSGTPMLAALDTAGAVRLSFEDLGARASDYSAYEGRIGPLAGRSADWYSHAGSLCNTVPGATGRGRDVVVMPARPAAGERGRYFLVTASDPCLEGPSGMDSLGTAHPAALLDCAP